MIQLLRRFSLKQKLILGFFILAAIIGSIAVFLVDLAYVIILLFWLLVIAVFLMIMLIRRLNAKIARSARGQSKTAVVKKKIASPPSRLNSDDSLKRLQRKFSRDNSPAVALPLAKKLLQTAGNIREASDVLDQMPPDTVLHAAEDSFVKRVKSLRKHLDEDFQLPKKHKSYNYSPQRNKLLYAVGMSPVSITNGYTSRTHGVASALSEQGVEVVVAPLPGKPWDKGAQDGFRVPSRQARYVSSINGVRYAHNPGVPAWEGDFDTFLQVSADAYVRESLIEKPEFILAASNYLSALPALIAARRLGIPFIYEMRGFWEVSAASVNPEWETSDQYRLDRQFDTFVAREADKVVVITDEMREELISRGIPHDRVFVAPNSVDIDEFVPLGKDLALLRKIGFTNPELPVIGFAGSVTSYEGLDLVVEALTQLRNEDKAFNFLIVGDGKFLPEVQTLVTKRGLDENTRYVNNVPRKDMPVYLSSIDIFPLARKSLPVTELVSPIKPLEAMSVAGVVVLSDVAPHRPYFEGGEERAISFSKNDVDSLTTNLRRLLNTSADERALIGYRARRWIKANRQWKHVGPVFTEILDFLRASSNEADALRDEHPLKSYKVAFIGDTFTSDTFLPELDAIRITPQNWRDVYSQFSIDALFIESAWQGNDQSWEGIVGYYDDETHRPIVELIEHNRLLGTPVMFWNKEDPVHFNRFKKTAALCDYVFTTDARMIVDYNELPDNNIKTVASAPFSAQPILHNPVPSTRQLEDTIAYGGTYYGDKYATRKQGLDFLFYESAPYGLAIYERKHNDPNSPYRLPERFKRYARESLSYPEMCQAYKAHPIHLNGNSVTDSPSMFSRRVVEIAASGSSVLSSAGRGVDETMAGLIPTVEDPDDANHILQRWKHSEEGRHRELWDALRHVNQAHTSAHRLTYMLRVAGLQVRSPELPKVAVQCSSSDVAIFEAQTLQPDLYLITDTEEVDCPRVPIVHLKEEALDAVLDHDQIQYVVQARSEVGTLGRYDVEDLVSALKFGDWKAVGKRVERWKAGDSHLPIAALTTDINDQIVLYDRDTYLAMRAKHSISLRDEDVFAWQVVIDDTAVAETKAHGSEIQRPQGLTVLLAGHDFKFFTTISAAIREAGHRILVDRWDGHNEHNEERSRRLLAEADVIFCEWALGNIRWYSHNKIPGQKLITRLHAQELRTKHLRETNIDNVDNFIFVSHAGMRRAQTLFNIPAKKSVVIGNTFDLNRFEKYRPTVNPKQLGMVGSVPRSKRLDLALDILEGLRSEDPSYELAVQGKQYTEFPWLVDRESENEYFNNQYKRIQDSILLQGAVEFKGHNPQIADWYLSGPGFILSTSDHEGTHQAIAEGGAAGCVPIIFPWPGAELVYGERWIVGSVQEAIDRIRELTSKPELFLEESFAAREYMSSHFNPRKIADSILEIIER
jgi:glycosyltransferase involved in cell wall biosynthesis